MAENYSEACCKIPPIKADYTPKGEYVTLAGIKTYKTGPATADTAIILVYDVFGLVPQVLQGADILAHSTSSAHQYQAYLPDFMNGETAEGSWFNGSNITPEMRVKMGKFFGPGGPASIADTVTKLKEVVEAIKKDSPGVKKFGVVGYCWGAKVCMVWEVDV
jgi:dienelactone hydrolase